MDIEALEKLNELKIKGIITEEEFNASKKKILEASSLEDKTQKINSNFVWGLSFAPFIGLFLEVLVAEATGIAYENLWFITVILNIVLSYSDAKQLKNLGFEGKMLDNAWFVPGYLYERSKLLNENPIYLWIWLGTFGFTVLF